MEATTELRLEEIQAALAVLKDHLHTINSQLKKGS